MEMNINSMETVFAEELTGLLILALYRDYTGLYADIKEFYLERICSDLPSTRKWRSTYKMVWS